MTAARTLNGRYRLVRRLGRGGMGVVWHARDDLLGRDVAVKELLLPDRLSPEQREQASQRALREARAAALLQHRSIVTVHDVVVDEGRPCIVMDLLPGRSLDAVTSDQGPLPPDQVARIGLEILDALRTAHAQGVLHRDVKPANIFLRDDGRAVLTDFGIAALEGDATLTREGALIGSPSYMAPERVRHGPSGPASDIWSLGATLYALTEGRPPFARDTIMGTLGAVLTSEPDPPRAAGPLGPLLMRMLVKDPASRATAEEAESFLRAVVEGRPTQPAMPVPEARPPRPRPRRSWVVPALAAAVTAALAIVIIVLAATRGDSGPPRTPPRAATAPGTAQAQPPERVRFATPPAPCGLISAEQAGRLVREFFSNGDEGRDASTGWPTRSCNWGTSPTASGAEDQDDDLTLELLTAPDTAGARAFLAKERENAAASPENIPGLGDEGFATIDSSGNSVVFFRVGNLAVEVGYRSERVPQARQSQDARRAAQWAFAALDRL
ncbi:protein kinase [Actinomadura sp. SCN-SB]|uniref:serine/threonine-protein kinase n=1 Tax=Actinomadura sp. SCN-SB TaxID=3373092 RepID=UPI00374FFC19